jgi:hypothetical protein
MQRREFLAKTGLVLGVGAPLLATGQVKPCPPPSVSANQKSPVTTPCLNGSTSLEQACAALASGQSANFPAGQQSAMSEPDVAWETYFHHDDQHGLIHLMGKAANSDDSWGHQYYNMATGNWTVVSRGMWNNPGHIYGNFAMDPGTGDLFQSRGGMDGSGEHPKRIGWYDRAKGSWGYAPVNRDFYAGALVSHANGCAFHPNLYGPGDGGVVLDTQFRTLFWRKSTDAVQDIPHDDIYGGLTSCAVYWPAKNIVLFGGAQDGGIAKMGKITPASSGSGTPTLTTINAPPIATFGASAQGSSNFGSLHVHPRDPNKLIIIERVGNRVFTTSDGTSWSQSGTHPFGPDPYVVCSLKGGLGAMWAVGVSGGTQISRLWKPA